jgi:pimeloyl-ACP methyl ester carboxylesterase
MLEQANSFGYRIILPNRRLYPGSTPYTKEEADAFEPTHSTEDITQAYLKQGEYLLLFVNNVIKEHKLTNVILVGWSLGTAFLSSTVASITTVSQEVQASLRKAVRTIVWWGMY